MKLLKYIKSCEIYNINSEHSNKSANLVMNLGQYLIQLKAQRTKISSKSNQNQFIFLQSNVLFYIPSFI